MTRFASLIRVKKILRGRFYIIASLLSCSLSCLCRFWIPRCSRNVSMVLETRRKLETTKRERRRCHESTGGSKISPDIDVYICIHRYTYIWIYKYIILYKCIRTCTYIHTSTYIIYTYIYTRNNAVTQLRIDKRLLVSFSQNSYHLVRVK